MANMEKSRAYYGESQKFQRPQKTDCEYVEVIETG